MGQNDDDNGFWNKSVGIGTLDTEYLSTNYLFRRYAEPYGWFLQMLHQYFPGRGTDLHSPTWRCPKMGVPQNR